MLKPRCSLSADLGASIQLPSLGAFSEDLAQAQIAHFTGYTLLADPMRGLTLGAIQEASSAGTRISLDVADPFVVDGLRTRRAASPGVWLSRGGGPRRLAQSQQQVTDFGGIKG